MAEELDKGKALKKLARKEALREKEKLSLRKSSEDYKAFEEVFDRRTLLTLYKMFNDGILKSLHGVVAAGKESRVYVAEGYGGDVLAVKIHLTTTSEFRGGRMKYILGDPRFSSIGRGMRKIVYTWASKEYKNLVRAYEAGVYVPRPRYYKRNILVMDFVGDAFTPAPTLKERLGLSPYIFKQVMRQVKNLYQKGNLIHTDLSEYNIFYYNRRPLLFDFAQAVVIGHPSAEKFLVSDISNILTFFSKRDIDIWNLEEALEWIKGT